MDRVKRPSPESQSSNLWVVVGVVIPVLVVTVIVVILYWKLCRTDKLDFQPDTVANIQQRQKVRSHPGVCMSVLTGLKQVQAQTLKDRRGPLKGLSALLVESSVLPCVYCSPILWISTGTRLVKALYKVSLRTSHFIVESSVEDQFILWMNCDLFTLAVFREQWVYRFPHILSSRTREEVNQEC